MEALTSGKIMTTNMKNQFENFMTIKVCGVFKKDLIIIETPTKMQDKVTAPQMLVRTHGAIIENPGFYKGYIVEQLKSEYIAGEADFDPKDMLEGMDGYTEYDIKYTLILVPDEK